MPAKSPGRSDVYVDVEAVQWKILGARRGDTILYQAGTEAPGKPRVVTKRIRGRVVTTKPLPNGKVRVYVRLQRRGP